MDIARRAGALDSPDLYATSTPACYLARMPQPSPHSPPARTDVAAGPMPHASGGDRAQQAPDTAIAEQLADCQAALDRALRDLELLSLGVSHDLHAPLRAINSFAALLDQHAGAGLDAPGRDYLARIRGAAGRMATLLDSLLALSRASRAALELADVDASLLAEWTLAELQDAEPARVAETSVQPGMVVRADERQLKLLFEQLLDNAWRFSRGRDTVRVSVTAARVGDAVRISVRDQGTGFDPAFAARVFEPFQRLHGPDEGGGHGLGLAIAHRIAERLGGTMAVDAVAGEGCTFHVDLPPGSGAAAVVAEGPR